MLSYTQSTRTNDPLPTNKYCATIFSIEKGHKFPYPQLSGFRQLVCQVSKVRNIRLIENHLATEASVVTLAFCYMPQRRYFSAHSLSIIKKRPFAAPPGDGARQWTDYPKLRNCRLFDRASVLAHNVINRWRNNRPSPEPCDCATQTESWGFSFAC